MLSAVPWRAMRAIRLKKAGRLVPAFCLWLSLAAGAQEPLPLDAAITRGSEIAQGSGGTGMVLAVVHGRKARIAGYGETISGSGTRPGPDSLVRLCSLTKVFTTDLLAQMAAAETVHLTDPLQRFAPAGMRVPTVVAGPPGGATPIPGRAKTPEITRGGASADYGGRSAGDHAG